MKYTKPELRNLNSRNSATGACFNGTGATGLMGVACGAGVLPDMISPCQDGLADAVGVDCFAGALAGPGYCQVGSDAPPP